MLEQNRHKYFFLVSLLSLKTYNIITIQVQGKHKIYCYIFKLCLGMTKLYEDLSVQFGVRNKKFLFHIFNGAKRAENTTVSKRIFKKH